MWNVQNPHNPAELGARVIVRQREVRFGTRRADGTKAWDTFLTLVATARKLGVSFYDYSYDRVSGAYEMPRLADLIKAKAKALELGASWPPYNVSQFVGQNRADQMVVLVL